MEHYIYTKRPSLIETETGKLKRFVDNYNLFYLTREFFQTDKYKIRSRSHNTVGLTPTLSVRYNRGLQTMTRWPHLQASEQVITGPSSSKDGDNIITQTKSICAYRTFARFELITLLYVSLKEKKKFGDPCDNYTIIPFTPPR